MHALRDATRGGLSAVLNEWAQASKICIEVEEDAVAISDQVRGICEMFGFEAMDLANEGTFIAAVPADEAERCIEVLKRFDFCQDASVIAEVTERYPSKVVLRSGYGTSRFLDLPKGELLPRIC